MSRRFINELSDGDTIEEIFLLADKQLRANRNADLYLLATLRDKTGVISGLMWNVTEESMAGINSGDYVRVKGKIQLYQGSLQMIVTSIRTVSPESIDPEDFRPQALQNIEHLLARLKEILLAMETPVLRSLVECYFIDEALMRDLAAAPAGVKAHHAYQGGLLEHIVNILETAVRIRDLYPEIDFDLLQVGIFLHDIGKIRELGYESTLSYTDEGQLLGHMVIAIEMLTEKIARTVELTGEPFPEELALRIKHMILSHHGAYEFGSSKLPMTPEAIALHHLDNLDAKVHEFGRTIDEDPNSESSWTPFINRLDRKLYKGANS